MKKYVNGEYIEMTSEEVAAWEEAQKAVEDSEGGGYKLIREIALEEEGLIDPITDVDYAAVVVDIIIPGITSGPRLIISTTSNLYNGYTCDAGKYSSIRVIKELDSRKNHGHPKISILNPYGTWIGIWRESYGIDSVPERINTISIYIGDTGNINFPAGTTVKIYAKE